MKMKLRDVKPGMQISYNMSSENRWGSFFELVYSIDPVKGELEQIDMNDPYWGVCIPFYIDMDMEVEANYPDTSKMIDIAKALEKHEKDFARFKERVYELATINARRE